MNLTALEIKPFVPATDLERSKAFYLALGFEVPWLDSGLAYVHHGSSAFLLQAFDAPGFAASFQMHLLVEDVDAWHDHAQPIAQRFGVAIGAPENRPWGMRDFTLFDPAGVLWRVAQTL